jgi:eukaryotic-like serine/threonine-protein kinase
MNSDDPDAQAIFGEALRFSVPGEREAYLDHACGGNSSLRQEIESLLSAYGQAQAGDFLGQSRPPVAPESWCEHPGTRIGRYKLLERLGEGGFGTVWMAEQEEPVRRRVALKIIKLGMDTREVVARFEAERQALALMEHPNIAHVFDGGATETGRPYFVMELVQGVPITTYCDTHNVSTRERLELFTQVCQAVQHAHQKGVIHRDLKPSNVLVAEQDNRAVPKVIDFGVAKATEARLTEKMLFTHLRQIIGTPAYMSPEQAGLGSLDVDTRSDIYSLGVLLYELLTGRTPFDTRLLLAAGYDAVMRTIREKEPPKPSTRLSTLSAEEVSAVAAHRGVEPQKLGKLVRGDLDAVVMKALEKDRARRYATAGALAEDLRRHLAHEPIAAAPSSPVDQLVKFARRNRTILSAVMAIAVVLVLATLVSLQSALVARKARRLADSERDSAVQARNSESAQRMLAEASARESRLRLVRLKTIQGLQLMEGGDWFGASLFFCDTLVRVDTNDPALAATRRRLGVILAYAPRLERMWFHNGSVNQASFSPDGRWVLTASQDGKARIFDIASGQLVGTAMSHDGPLRGAEFSPDGRYVLTICENESARIWDAASGQPLSPPLVHRLPLQRALFAADGHCVYTVSGRSWISWRPDGVVRTQRPESEIRVWDAPSGRELRGVYWRGTNSTHLAASPGGLMVAVGYEDGQVGIFDERPGLGARAGRSGAEIGERPATSTNLSDQLEQNRPRWRVVQSERVNHIAFSADGTHMATAGSDGSALLWELGNDGAQWRVRAGGKLSRGLGTSLQQVAFSPDGRRVLTLAKNGLVGFWNGGSGESSGQLTIPIGGATAAVFSPDGRRIAVSQAAAGGLGEVRVWDISAGQSWSPVLPHAGLVTSACFSLNGSRLLTASADGCARLWNLVGEVPPLPPLQAMDHAPQAEIGTRAADSHLLAVFSRDGRRVATSGNGVARIWDSATGQPVTPTFDCSYAVPANATFSPDGSRFAIAGGWRIGQARVYDSATGRPLTPVLRHKAPLIGESGTIAQATFSPDGRWLVTVDSSEVRLWNTDSGEPIPLSFKSALPIRDFVFSPDGRWIAALAGPAAALLDQNAVKQLQVWRAATGEPAIAPVTWTGAVSRVMFSPDGCWLAVLAEIERGITPGGESGTASRIQLLNLSADPVNGPLFTVPEPLGPLCFSGDSKVLWTIGGRSGRVMGWDLLRGGEIPVRQRADHNSRIAGLSADGRWMMGSVQEGWRIWETISGEPVTPVLGRGHDEASELSEESLDPEGRAVLAGSSDAPQLWPLPSDNRSAEEITRHVQLLAAREFDASGNLIGLVPGRLSELWSAVLASSPAAYTVGADPTALWHLHQAAQSERSGQWSAAEFHLTRLLNTALDSAGVRQRLAEARAKAALEALERSSERKEPL